MSLLFYSPTGFCERLILSLTEKIFLPLPSNLQVKIGDKNLVQIHQEEGQLSLSAKKEGQTSLMTGGKHYELFIFSKEKKIQALHLDKMLKNFWGLSWSVSDKNIFQITGILNRLYDWVELSKVSRELNILYEFKAIPGEGLKPRVHHYFKSLFKDRIPPEILWHKMPLADLPQGTDLSEYEKFLRPFGLISRENPSWQLKEPFIEIEIALVEGLSSSGVFFGGAADNSLQSFSSLLAFLNFLKSSGQGKTLHHSSVVSQSGQRLHIQSGGQIPFNIHNLKTEQKSVQWKSYGLHLNLLPKLDQKNQIELDIKAKISEPLSFSSLDSPPPLKTQSLENRVLLKDGQIIKLFQLKKKSKGVQNRNRISFLPSFPNFFLNGKNKYEMTQFIFVQANILDKKIDKKKQKLF